jgi:Ca2+/Na+ antiporter
MKKEEKNHNKSSKKGFNKNDLNFYKFLLVVAVFVIIVFLVLVFIFYKPKKTEDSGLPSLGPGKQNDIGNYSYDPEKLADGKNNLFIDQNNPICSNSYSRNQVINPKTPWCDVSVFYSDNKILNDEDIVFIRNGTKYTRLSFPIKFDLTVPINQSQFQNSLNNTKNKPLIEIPEKGFDLTFYIFVIGAIFFLIVIVIVIWFVIKYFKRMSEIDSLKRRN